MRCDFDILIRNARLDDRHNLLDIGITNGRIAAIEMTIADGAEIEIDADGGLVSPGLVDAHVHMDKAFAATGEQVPKFNDDSFDYDRIVGVGRDYFEQTPTDVLEENAVRHGLCALANGTRYLRTHVTVHPAWGTKTVEAVAAARERLREVLHIEIVAYSEEGVLDDKTPSLLVDCVDAGADLVGCMDPASIDGEVDAALETLLDVATTAGVDIDSHIHEPGPIGVHTIRKIAAMTSEYGMDGDVTVSHGFALASAQNPVLIKTLAEVREAGLNIVACHQSVRSNMPFAALNEADVSMGQGTDNIRDFVFAHGRADLVDGLLFTALRLAGDPAGSSFRQWETNDALARLWELPTTGGAGILDIQNYGVAEGSPADVVVYAAPSPQWVIASQARRRAVIASGQLVAQNGRLESAVPEAIGYEGPLL